jgi:hypothetical protein
MRAALLLSTIVAVGIFASPATAQADPGYADLPSGNATAPPEAAPPAFIAASEKVPGFFVARPTFVRRFTPGKVGAKASPAPSFVIVVPTAEHARKVESGDFGGGGGGDEAGPCFSQVRRLGGAPHRRRAEAEGDEQADSGGTPPIPDWNEGLGSSATINAKTEQNPMAGVTAVHRERLVTDASGTRVEIDDVWVDPTTKGVRTIASATLPLKLVGSSRGLRIFAARDERADGTKAVQFVVAPASGPSNGSEGLVAMPGDGRNVSSSSCSHLRVAMSAADGAADSAVLRTTIRLPDVEREAPRVGEDEEKRERVREAAIQLGVSKTKRDAQPILSVTFGSSGRETSLVVRNAE